MSTPEGLVKAMVNRQLAQLSRVYRFMPVQNGMGAPGLDYYLCCAGCFVSIETKAKGKALTARQQITKKAIEDAGGKVFVVDDAYSLTVAVNYIMALCDDLRCP